MNKLDCTIPKLINMLVTAEEILKNLRGIILIMEWTSSSKRKSGWKKKNKSMKKHKKESKPNKNASKKAVVKEKYFHCDADGNWRRNYPLYLESLKKEKPSFFFVGSSRFHQI